MKPEELADQLLEVDARALSQLWLDIRLSLAQATAEADTLTSRAQARGDPRPALLSLAFRAVRLRTSNTAVDTLLQELDATLAHLRQAGWQRAVELAEAAWALAQRRRARPDPSAEAVLLAHEAPTAQARPAVERLWSHVARSRLCAGQSDYDQALVSAMKAEELARESGNDFAVIVAVQALAFTFLSVGDVEGAAAVLARGTAACRRVDRYSWELHYNLLLSQVVSRRYADAASLIEQTPALRTQIEQRPGVFPLSAMVALIWAHSGRSDQATALLAQSAQAGSESSQAMRANRIWMRGAALLALGRHRQARAEVEAGLQDLLADACVLSPLNGTQLYRTLSEACEACDDIRASLQALKRSQAYCYQWVSSSVRSRLNVLHRAVNGADNAQQARRQAAVSQTAALAAHQHDASELQRQRRFLHQVTHEMRNPLGGIIGMTSLVMMSDLDERQRKHLGIAQMSAQVLLSLCNDVLDLAKLEAGKFELHLQPVDVAEVLHMTAEMFRPLAQAQGVVLSCHLDPALPRQLQCDKLRLQQVLMNLLGNATKFTRRGSIELDAVWHGAVAGTPGLHVRVRDTGPGLDEAACARLFQEFSQADSSVAQSHGGTGLGLALCRSLVHLMGGEIGVDSAPGHGSLFWFHLPISPA